MNAILFWNEVALEVHRRDFAGTDKPEHDGPTRTSRALAIVHLAMYDAVAQICDLAVYGSNFRKPTAAEKKSVEAAIGGAASTALARLWDRQRAYVAEKAAEFAATMLQGAWDTLGSVQYGRALAEALVALREGDGYNAPSYHTPSGAALSHRQDPYDPNVRYLGPQWGQVRPFLINNGQPAPATGLRGRIDHAKYLSPWNASTKTAYDVAFKQVKEKGALTGSTRTPEETVIGIFWGYDGAKDIGTPPRLYNQCVRAIRDEKNKGSLKGDIRKDALLFALVHAGMADAGIVAWAAKYEYNLWRPIIGIREHDAGYGPGLGSGMKPAGAGDPFWRPLGAPSTNRVGEINVTPPFPAYPSGHATFGTACFEIARAFYDGADVEFSVVSDEFNGKSKDADGSLRVSHNRRLSISGAIRENILSRVYLGVHWIFDGEGGEEAGRKIAGEIAALGIGTQKLK